MAEQFSSSGGVAPLDAVSKVELSISCTNLKDMDVFSKSDPVVFLYERRGREWQKLGRTEVIDNNLNPKVGECPAPSDQCVLNYGLETPAS